jgi:hypothetical protein
MRKISFGLAFVVLAGCTSAAAPNNNLLKGATDCVVAESSPNNWTDSYMAERCPTVLKKYNDDLRHQQELANEKVKKEISSAAGF